LQAQTGALTVNAGVSSGSGHISVWSLGAQSYTGLGDITTGSRVDIGTTYRGTIDLEAGASITMNAGSVFTTDGGNVRIRATGATSDITVGDVVAGTGSVAMIAGRSILDADALVGSPLGNDGDLDVTAASLRLSAVGSVGVQGASANAIETEVVTLAATAGSGGINVVDVGLLAIGTVSPVAVKRVTASGELRGTDETDAGALAGLTTTGNGRVLALAGSMTVDEAVSAHGSGDVLLQAQTGTLTVNAAVASGSGHISVLSAGAQSYTVAGALIATGSRLDGGTTRRGTIDLSSGSVRRTEETSESLRRGCRAM
jgi:hypothetical protein